MNDTPQADPDVRRLRTVPVSPQFLAQMLFRPSHGAIAQDWPKDARFVRASYDYARDLVLLTYRSSAWDVVPLGDAVPELRPLMRVVLCFESTAPFAEMARAALDTPGAHLEFQTTPREVQLQHLEETLRGLALRTTTESEPTS